MKQKKLALSLAFAMAGLGGCVSLETLAPQVPGPFANSTEQSKIALGRQLYVTTCTKCHAVEPVKKYSLAEWGRILPEMAEEANTSPEQTESLRCYLQAVLKQN